MRSETLLLFYLIFCKISLVLTILTLSYSDLFLVFPQRVVLTFPPGSSVGEAVPTGNQISSRSDRPAHCAPGNFLFLGFSSLVQWNGIPLKDVSVILIAIVPVPILRQAGSLTTWWAHDPRLWEFPPSNLFLETQFATELIYLSFCCS